MNAIKRVVRRLSNKPAELPSGGLLTARIFLQVGFSLGGSPSSFASLHALFSSAFVSDDDNNLKDMDMRQPFDDHPIYFLMRESLYVDDNSDCRSSEWSTFKACKEASEFNFQISSQTDGSSEPTFLTGEKVFRWMADGNYAELSGTGMRGEPEGYEGG